MELHCPFLLQVTFFSFHLSPIPCSPPSCSSFHFPPTFPFRSHHLHPFIFSTYHLQSWILSPYSSPPFDSPAKQLILAWIQVSPASSCATLLSFTSFYQLSSLCSNSQKKVPAQFLPPKMLSDLLSSSSRRMCSRFRHRHCCVSPLKSFSY